MKHGVLAAASLCLFCLALLATPAVAQTFGVSPATMNLEVPGDGTGEAEFTILGPNFTGEIEIGLEDIPLEYEPKTVSVEAGVDKEVVITFQGNESLGSIIFKGEVTFLPVASPMYVVGYEVSTYVTHRVEGVPFATTYSLNVSVEPEGSGLVTLDPAKGPYASGTEVTLTAVPVAGYIFDHWSGDASGTDSEVVITMDSDKTVTAHFTLGYGVIVSIEPEGSGSVTLHPGEGPYASGTEVTLTAVPASGCTFDHWSGDASGTDAEVTITVDSDKTVTAHFAPAVGTPGWVYPLVGVLGGALVIVAGLWLVTRRRPA